MLRTNLFNPRDKIAPVENYFYADDGQILKAKMRKRTKNIRDEIERFDKRLLLMKLTEEFGGRAVKIMNAINKNEGTLTKEMLHEFELYRVMSSKQEESVLNTMYQQPDETKRQGIETMKAAMDLSHMNFQLQPE